MSEIFLKIYYISQSYYEEHTSAVKAFREIRAVYG